jgi:hypothetical protein
LADWPKKLQAAGLNTHKTEKKLKTQFAGLKKKVIADLRT